ncbi:MlaD family protein [Marinobacterium sediminicola]|uniref:Phospholipid/cholesterol/gamma-HCH transport system substrate-binding protein n=1 Tax=Marinobacterium sediminicola TaxID=518898 RepID=A0ABY1S1C2_9GAMM|nr:MlaD family protein [Marinobacterium sediminicola]ULG69843.1 MlaD family protein [Marinobacterium sediminicola]SMR75342.1 phospholipid/cholesterol/gamma-HCH transport system substrate-binding protein [Marinobacterium sediminicola]
METRAHHVIIGLFTLLSLLLALGFGVWLVKSGKQQETARYRVVFEEAVTGLSVGSLVQYNGLRVGEVRRLQLDPADPRRVLADMEVSATTPINQGTRARLAIANITGAANILLSTDNPNALPLAQQEDSPPVIVAEPSAIGSLLGNSETLFANVNELVEQGAQLLSAENIDSIGRIIRNLERVSDELVESRAGLGETLNELTQAARDAQIVMRDASELLAHADRMLADRGEPMLAEGQKAMQSMAQISQQLERLLSQNSGALSNGLQGMAEIGPVMQELQRSLGTLNRILARLEEDPAGYLTGKAPANEFTP